VKQKVEVDEQVNALKARRGRTEAIELARNMDRIIAARGPTVTVFNMRDSPPEEATLLKHLLGPTGNLRAPAMRFGKTLLIGFHPAEFEKFLTSPLERP
jgi:hypothetical protein